MRRAAPRSEELTDELLDAISAVRRALRRKAGPVAEMSTLTNAQLQLVRVVHRHPGLSVADASYELGVAPNTVSTLVHQLLDVGILERKSGPPDRRIAQLFACEAVSEHLAEWLARRSEAIEIAARSLTPEDHRALAGSIAPLFRLAEAVGRNGELG